MRHSHTQRAAWIIAGLLVATLLGACASVPQRRSSYPHCLNRADCRPGQICVAQLCSSRTASRARSMRAPGPSATPAENPGRVMVFDVAEPSQTLTAPTRQQLTDYLAAQLTEQAGYRIVPGVLLRRRLAEQKKQGYADRFDRKSQVALGAALAADHTLDTKILRVGSRCAISATLYDLKTETSKQSASVDTDCFVDSLMVGMKRLAAKLATPR
ncbi:MAG: hypothetical protein H6707_18310 [Deltaproteobacteria bacterium]|nr:hypothetical protein [Deltaproteobacteria bacterium]